MADPLVDQLLAEQRENSKTIVFLAELLGKTLGERDKARDLAVRLEAEIARLAKDRVYPD